MCLGDEEDDEGKSLCLSQLCKLSTFAKTGPDLKDPTCPDLCSVINPGELLGSFESGSSAR